jgi:hypothetical protein
MGCLGVHFAITEEQMGRLLKAARRGDDEVLEVVSEIEEAWQERHLDETDKAWDAIHRCLTNDHTPGGRLNPRKGAYPLKLCILGGKHLHRGEDYTVALVRPDQVPAVAQALAKLTKAWLRERFFALDPKACRYAINEDELDYVLGWFKGLPRFFARAARQGRAVIFTADH